jgi:hypothetical protein
VVRGFEAGALQTTRAPFSGTSGTLGWDVPAEEEPANLDAIAPLGFGNPQGETVIPTDRHTRGADVGKGGAGRVRENTVGDMPVRQQPNGERRIFGECSRRIAQIEGQAAHNAWEKRVADDCQACNVVPG